MIFTPACGWGVSIFSGCCSVSHLVLTIQRYGHGMGGSGWPRPPGPPPPPPLEENLIYKKTSFCGVGYPWTLLQEWACNPLQFSRPPALLTFVPCHFQFCSHGPDKGIKKLTNCFFVSVSQAIFSYWVTSNLFTIGQVALLKHPAARKAMGIPEMITHPSSQDPGGFWENMKAGMLPALLPGLYRKKPWECVEFTTGSKSWS